MDQLFEGVFNGFGVPSTQSGLGSASPFAYLQSAGVVNGYRPLVDVSGDETSYAITLDVPGLSESDLSIEVKGDVLSMDDADADAITASLNKGVLSLTISRREAADGDVKNISITS